MEVDVELANLIARKSPEKGLSRLKQVHLTAYVEGGELGSSHKPEA